MRLGPEASIEELWVYGSHIPGSTHNIFKAATPTNAIFIIALFGTI
jgi:hypothetical protein